MKYFFFLSIPLLVLTGCPQKESTDDNHSVTPDGFCSEQLIEDYQNVSNSYQTYGGRSERRNLKAACYIFQHNHPAGVVCRVQNQGRHHRSPQYIDTTVVHNECNQYCR